MAPSLQHCVNVRTTTCLAGAASAVLFGAAVHQDSARFANTCTSKGWARAVAQQPLQRSAVLRCGADPCVHRQAAVLVGQHVFGITTLQEASPVDAEVKLTQSAEFL